MCGICGIINLIDRRDAVPAETLRALTGSMAHRGPDDEGYYVDDRVGLGHRRLSIIDLEGGRQPIANESGSVVVIANGEIYNFQSLREDLAAQGHRFLTKSDTEVLVHGYEQWGMEGLLDRLNGMYALCLYDRGEEVVYLARDRMGKKPLYYATQGGRFLFASEIRGLVANGLVAKQLSTVALNHYIRMHFSFGEESLVAGVKRLLPGHYLCIDLRTGTFGSREYWRPKVGLRARERPFVEYCEELRYLLTDAVRLRRIADVPVGTFLSGGLDSSIVTALLARWIRPLDTFSIGFEDGGFDESPFSRAVSSHVEARHHPLLLTGARLRDLLTEIADKVDEPVADAAIMPTYWLSREARRSVTVVLTGEGADELFGGYDYYQAFLKGPLTDRDREQVVEAVKAGAEGPADGAGFPTSILSDFPFALPRDVRERIVHPDCAAPGSLREYYEAVLRAFDDRGATHLDRALMADMRGWLVDDILMKLDKMSMLNSLEVRAPFLDHRVVEFALAVPDEYRIHEGREKHLLREAFRDFLPASVVERRKQGFNLPMAEWLRKDLYPLVEEYLSPRRCAENGFLNGEELSRVISLHMGREAGFQRVIFAVLLLQMWWAAL